jgi:predicted ester cyclase
MEPKIPSTELREQCEIAIRTIVEIFTTGDLDNVNSVVADNYVDHQGLQDIEIRGQDGFRQVVEAARGSLRDLNVAINDLLIDREKVAARLRWQGTSGAGHEITRETIDILRIEKGRMVEHWGAELWTTTRAK